MSRNKISERDNFIALTAGFMILLFAQAAATQFFEAGAQRWVQSLLVMTLVLFIWGVKGKDKWYVSSLGFFICVFSVVVLSAILDNFNLGYIQLVLLLAFFLSSARTVAKQVLFSGIIDTNKILGSICLYILLALIWAVIYSLCHLSFQGAFANVADGRWYEVFSTFIYFSFVTITTLGYGDISPSMPVTEFFVFMQALAGQFYIAILVASLVGTKMTQKQLENHSETQ